MRKYFEMAIPESLTNGSGVRVLEIPEYKLKPIEQKLWLEAVREIYCPTPKTLQYGFDSKGNITPLNMLVWKIKFAARRSGAFGKYAH